jgi:hypothetical protein
MHIYEVRPRKDKRGVDLISDVPPFSRLWYGEPNAVGNAVGYAKHFSRSHDAVIRVYDDAGNVIERHEPRGRFPRGSRSKGRTIASRSQKLMQAAGYSFRGNASQDDGHAPPQGQSAETKFWKKERPPMRRPLRFLLNAGAA